MSAKTQDAPDRAVLERLAERHEYNAALFDRVADSCPNDGDTPRRRRCAAEARLIADALRFHLAALSAPPAEVGAADHTPETE